MIQIRLKEILKERNMSLLELSEMTNISSTTLSQFQNKKTEAVHYNTLDKITAALNVSVGDIIVNIDEPNKKIKTTYTENISTSDFNEYSTYIERAYNRKDVEVVDVIGINKGDLYQAVIVFAKYE